MRFFFLIIAFFACVGDVGIGFCAPSQTSTIQVDGATVELGAPKGFIPATEGIYSGVLSATQGLMSSHDVHAVYVSLDAQKTHPLYEYAIVTTLKMLSGKKLRVEDFARVKEESRSRLPLLSREKSFLELLEKAIGNAKKANGSGDSQLPSRADPLAYFHETPLSTSMMTIIPGYLGGFPPNTAVAAIATFRLVNLKFFTVFQYRPVKNMEEVFAFIAASENFMNELLPEMESGGAPLFIEKGKVDGTQWQEKYMAQDTEAARMSPVDRVLGAFQKGFWGGAVKMTVALLFMGLLGLAARGFYKDKIKKTS